MRNYNESEPIEHKNKASEILDKYNGKIIIIGGQKWKMTGACTDPNESVDLLCIDKEGHQNSSIKIMPLKEFQEILKKQNNKK